MRSFAISSGLLLAALTTSCTNNHAAPGTTGSEVAPGCVFVSQTVPDTVVQPDGSRTESRKARSGDFTAGNFLDLDNELRTPSGQPVAKLYWIPTVGDVAKFKPLTLTIVTADGSGSPGSTQSFGGNGDWAKTADGRYFWPTQVIFPAPGAWRVTASAPGLADGCFLVTVA